VGVSIGTIQHYFGSRRRLLTETFAFETERSVDRWIGAERDGATAWGHLLALIEIVLDPPTFRERWTRWLQFWAAYARDPKLRRSMGEVYDRWREPLRRAIAAGVE
jgi:AcrR family transcriptional regulator